MQIIVSQTPEETAEKAAGRGADFLRAAIADRGAATMALAAASCQSGMLARLAKENVDWSRVTAFQLGEILGIPGDHPASMRRFLKEHFTDALRRPIEAFHFIEPDLDASEECRRLEGLLESCEVDVAFLDIGENARLGLNDPPADCRIETAYLVVEMDEGTRWQMIEDGWFGELAGVPTRAVTMSIRRMMRSRAIICTAPEARKAPAVENALLGLVVPEVPASVLKMHGECHVFLDKDSSSGLRKRQ